MDDIWTEIYNRAPFEILSALAQTCRHMAQHAERVKDIMTRAWAMRVDIGDHLYTEFPNKLRHGPSIIIDNITTTTVWYDLGIPIWWKVDNGEVILRGLMNGSFRCSVSRHSAWIMLSKIFASGYVTFTIERDRVTIMTPNEPPSTVLIADIIETLPTWVRLCSPDANRRDMQSPDDNRRDNKSPSKMFAKPLSLSAALALHDAMTHILPAYIPVDTPANAPFDTAFANLIPLNMRQEHFPGTY